MTKKETHFIGVRFSLSTRQEVDRLCEKYDLKITDLFRYSLMLMRIYVKAIGEGKQVRLVDPKNPDETYAVELPLFPVEEKLK